MPWDDETQEYYPNAGGSTVECVMCGQEWDEDSPWYTTIGDSPVCDNECKWDFITEEFTDYLKKNNVLDKVKTLAANPNLDSILALKRDLAEAGADESGEAADINLIQSIVGKLYDAEELIKWGMEDELPATMQELIVNVDAAVTRERGRGRT